MMELTSAALAAALGITERRVATVKAEGRLPLTGDGKIDIAALLRLGWTGALRMKGVLPEFFEATEQDLREARGLAPAFAFTEPMHRGFATAVLIALYEVPSIVAVAASDAGATRAQAEQMSNLTLILLWEEMNKAGRQFGLPDAEGEGPIYPQPDVTDWKGGVNWPALFDKRGRSIAMATPTAGTNEAPGA